MTDLVKLEIFLRGGALATLMFCGALFASRSPLGRKDVAVAALCVGLCAYVLVSSPSIGIGAGVTFDVLATISAVVPVLVYWTALELFQDELRFEPWQLITCGIIVATAWLSFTSVSVGVVRGIGVIVIFAHLTVVILQGEKDDLIESRRRFRRWFLLSIAGIGLIITGLEIAGIDRGLPLAFYLIHALLFWGLAVAFLLWATRVDPGVWLVERPPIASKNNISPAQSALIGRINTAVSEELWRSEGLTLGQMAQALNTEEHRLRAAINQGLGYRNFSSFINSHRIEHAKGLLRDPNLAERTVLSIAYEVGFASLGPFNRAFRQATGMTPTAYRAVNMDIAENAEQL